MPRENSHASARRNVCRPHPDLYSERMNETEREILATLRDLEAKVEAMRTDSPKPNLLPVFEKLETLTRALGPEADHSLLHYLHKKSYEKARLHLEGRDAENARGACRH
jgi:hypothetical protein